MIRDFLIAGVLVSGCNPAPVELTVPEPDISRVSEPEVVREVERLRMAVIAEPDSAGPWGAYADLLSVHRWIDEAVESFARAEGLEAGEFRWPYMQAIVLAARDPERAALAARRALAIDSDYAPAHVRYARLLEELGQPALAMSHALLARKLAPESVDTALCLGQLLLLRDSVDEATAALNVALRLDPTHPEVHSALARAYHAAGRADDARRHAELARLRAGPIARTLIDPRGQAGESAAVSHRRVGEAFAMQGRCAEAVEHFERALNLRPDHEGARTSLVNCLVRLERADDARRVLEDGMRELPDSLRLLERLADLVAESRDYARAATLYKQLLDLRPDDASILVKLGVVALALDNAPIAEEFFRRALVLDPRNFQALHAAGVLCGKTDRVEEGLRLLERASALRPDDPELARNLAALREKR